MKLVVELPMTDLSFFVASVTDIDTDFSLSHRDNRDISTLAFQKKRSDIVCMTC